MPSTKHASADPTLSLIVPQHLVKTVKDRLQANNRLDRREKIHRLSTDEPFHAQETNEVNTSTEPRYSIPTTWILHSLSPTTGSEAVTQLLHLLSLQDLAPQIGYQIAHLPRTRIPVSGSNNNKLAQVLHTWLLSLPPTVPSTAINNALSLPCWTYTIYPPMLLLPSGAHAGDRWPALLTAGLESHHEKLWVSICEAFKVTHIALNAVIPGCVDSDHERANTIRSPTNLTPLYGDFGPSLPPPPEHEPGIKDFRDAFWCGATQNGILQTWAPRYTMFSRGNLSEKTRVLGFRSLTRDGLGGSGPSEISAVDLYAGIGYFAFSYAKAGVGKVLCWEINAWSVEGLRRGAVGNGWSCRILEGGQKAEVGQADIPDEQLVVFKESNELAVARTENMRAKIPPIRHVNCGLLPSSSDSWKTAVCLLDPVQGGWIHAHENVNAKDIERKKAEVVKTFTALVVAYARGPIRYHARVLCEHVETVKSYGPRVNHCVFDIAILLPQPGSSKEALNG